MSTKKIILAKEYSKIDKSSKINKAADLFVEELIDICAYAIEQHNLVIKIRRNEIMAPLADVPRDVLLYGHRASKTDWTKRTPLTVEQLGDDVPTPFVRVQQFLWDSGWYLIEISDPDVEINNYGKAQYNVVLRLYNKRPDNKYFDKRGVLWHNNNLFSNE